MANGIPPWIAILAAVVGIILYCIHIVHVFIRSRALKSALHALKPPLNIMSGECCYKKQRPEKVPIEKIEQLYCMNPENPRLVEDRTECFRCELRVLPYEGYQYLDQIHLEGKGVAAYLRIVAYERLEAVYRRLQSIYQCLPTIAKWCWQSIAKRCRRFSRHSRTH
jgi:hypothetical protein